MVNYSQGMAAPVYPSYVASPYKGLGRSDLHDTKCENMTRLRVKRDHVPLLGRSSAAGNLGGLSPRGFTNLFW